MTDKEKDRINLKLAPPTFEIDPQADFINRMAYSGDIHIGSWTSTTADNTLSAVDAAVAVYNSTRADLGETQNRSFNHSEEKYINYIISQKNSTYSHRFPGNLTPEDERNCAIKIHDELKNETYINVNGKPYPYKDFLSDFEKTTKSQ